MLCSIFDSIAQRIVDERPTYRLFENNCQNFVKFLLEILCPDASIPETIQCVLGHLHEIVNTELLFPLPGSYPLSVTSTSGTSFVTAPEVIWVSSSGEIWMSAVELPSNDSDDISPTILQDQLLSIAFQKETVLIIPSQRDMITPLTEKLPVSLTELISYISPENLFKHLPIRDVIAARGLCQSMKACVDDYFLHCFLPWIKITIYSRYIDDDVEMEYEILTPVLRRIDKEKRFLPHGRVLFEPNNQTRLHYHGHGRLEPVVVEMQVPEGTKYTWPLVRASVTRYLKEVNTSIVSHRKIYQYYKFEHFKNSPAHFFYKDSPDSELRRGFALHALSYPLEWLRQVLYNDIGKG